MDRKVKLRLSRLKRCKKCNKVGHEEGNCAVNIQEIIYNLDPDEKKYVSSVSLRRSSDKWQVDIPLAFDEKRGFFRKKIYFDIGKNEFKFVLNNREWKTSALYDRVSNQMGDFNNVLDVKPMSKSVPNPALDKSIKSEIKNEPKQRVGFNVSFLELLENEDLRLTLGKGY